MCFVRKRGNADLTDRRQQHDFGPLAVAEFSPNDPSTPTRVISGPATELGTDLGKTYPSSMGGTDFATAYRIAVGPDGTLYVLNVATSDGPSPNTYVNHLAVTEYATTANGNAAPLATSFRMGSLAAPRSLAVDSHSNVYAGDANSSSGVEEYTNKGKFVTQFFGGSTGIGLTSAIAIEPGTGFLTLSSKSFVDPTTMSNVGTTGIFTFDPAATQGSAPVRSFVPADADVPASIAYDGAGRL